MKNLKFAETDKAYFDALPEAIQTLIKCMLWTAFEEVSKPDTYPYEADECIEQVECRSRSGFIPFSHNCGGLQLRAFTDLMGFWGGGYSVSHKKAQAEIERQIEYSLEYASEDTYERFKAFFDAQGIKPEDCTYVNLQDLAEKSNSNSFDEPLQYIQDAECEALSGTENSIMYELRFMYHGVKNGVHSASVSATINTEGPYHRSHISWAPSVFCEGAKEVEITWKTKDGLKRKLAKALKTVIGEIF